MVHFSFTSLTRHVLTYSPPFRLVSPCGPGDFNLSTKLSSFFSCPGPVLPLLSSFKQSCAAHVIFPIFFPAFFLLSIVLKVESRDECGASIALPAFIFIFKSYFHIQSMFIRFLKFIPISIPIEYFEYLNFSRIYIK